MKKMVTTSLDLTNSTQAPLDFLLNSSEETLALNEGTNRIRCSTLLSLAITVGACSFWVANPTQSAFAADILTYQTTSVEKNNQNPSLILNQSTSPLKHDIKPGETLWQLSQNYHIEPEAIAQVNNITLQTDLQVGQTLKIPTSENQSSPRPEKISSSELDQSLNNLKESRRKLQESLVALRSNQITEQPTLIAQTPISQPEEPIKSLSDSIDEIDESSSLAIKLNRPIPIVVPTPGAEVSNLQVEPTLIQVPEVTPTTTTSDTVASYQSIPVEESQKEPMPEEPTVALQTPKLIAPAHDTFYQVQVGDTLKTIAESHGISVQALSEANQITDPNMIRVNQSLLIPSEHEQSIFNSQLPPVPQVKPISTSVVATSKPSQTTASVQPKAVSLSVDTSTPTQTEKLREDFAHLEQAEQISTHSEQVSVSIPINANVIETRPQPRNSEWDNGNSNSVIKKPENLETRPTIVGTASIQVEPYIDNLKIPVGTTVDPEFPALSNPNEYLPETQPIFQGFIWPAKGVLTSGYGRRWGKMHRGIDIAAPVGTPIIAAAPGQVVSSGYNNGGYGNLVKVKHADGSVTLYAHNSRLLVRSGQQVQQGQQIAQMGSTGFSTGPHLHFEVHRNGQGAVNPIAFLPKK
jgi:murein DD-endopeptidase MepM/ murein hydrolase activator NlpD